MRWSCCHLRPWSSAARPSSSWPTPVSWLAGMSGPRRCWPSSIETRSGRSTRCASSGSAPKSSVTAPVRPAKPWTFCGPRPNSWEPRDRRPGRPTSRARPSALGRHFAQRWLPVAPRAAAEAERRRLAELATTYLRIGYFSFFSDPLLLFLPVLRAANTVDRIPDSREDSQVYSMAGVALAGLGLKQRALRYRAARHSTGDALRFAVAGGQRRKLSRDRPGGNRALGARSRSRRARPDCLRGVRRPFPARCKRLPHD